MIASLVSATLRLRPTRGISQSGDPSSYQHRSTRQGRPKPNHNSCMRTLATSSRSSASIVWPSRTQISIGGAMHHHGSYFGPTYPNTARGIKMAGKFEIYQDKGGKFRFRLNAGHGEII